MPFITKLIASLCLVLLALAPSSSFAWGWEAHKLICAMAEEQLTPAGKEMVDRLMADGSKLVKGGSNFAESCLWPDDVKYSTRKSTYEHHFINVPEDATTVNLTRDCGAINCTAVGIQQALTYLARPTDGDRAELRRAAALRFLGHYVGDLHQPMHVGNAADWGGNKVKVMWNGEETNLHSMWDYKIPEKMGLRYPGSLEWLLSIDAPADNSQHVMDWFNESLGLARSHAYANTDGQLIVSGDTLTDGYFERAKPIVLARMTLAAKRLADLLNRVAAGEDIRVFELAAVSDPKD